MQSCLGIYIDNSMIKYSKITKDKENIKIEASGVRFYQDLAVTLDQIIKETNSQKLPISINISGEEYDYIDVFALLTKSDIKKSIDIEFEMLCNERGFEKNLYENRYFLSVNRNNPDKMRALNVSVMKNNLLDRVKPFDGCKIASVTPISTSIANLLDLNSKTNAIIVNIEDVTTVTTILDGVIDEVKKIDDGMKDVLEQINESENSLAKSYEICKNTTISTQDTGVSDGNEYLDIVMPTIYKIVNEVKKIEEGIPEKIDAIYLTGSGIAVNNVDLYFQNYFENIHCEMLRPSFLKSTSLKVPIKEYIEVNSATALALEGVGKGIDDLNFKVTSGGTKNIAGIEITGIPEFKKPEINKEKLDNKEKLLVRILVTILIFAIGYGVLSNIVTKDFVKAENKIMTEEKVADESLKEIENDKKDVEASSASYEHRYNKLLGIEDNSDSSNVMKDAIPIFLQQVMYSVPSEVMLVSIENTTGNTMSIVAKSEDYEQLGLFKVMLYSDGILTDVTSTSSYKEDKEIYVTIMGNLPE